MNNEVRKKRRGKTILHGKAEWCDQHKICFKQDIYKYNIIYVINGRKLVEHIN